MNICIAITGGSASGKTTLANAFIQYIGADNCCYLQQDRYYKQGLQPEETNYDHPDSFDFTLFKKHLIELQNGNNIAAPLYDYVTHSRIGNENIKAQNIIIADGILLMHLKALQEVYTYSIYLKTPEHIRLERRIIRDVRERGRSEDSVKTQFYTQVKPMYDLYVQPQQYKCSMVVENNAFVAEEIVPVVLKHLNI